MLSFYRSWLSIRDVEVPTIAAVNGAAVGAGFAVALSCDIRYAAADARLGVPFTSLGLHPGMATTWSLPNIAGHAVARDLLLTGRIVTGAEAVGLGLVSQALPTADSPFRSLTAEPYAPGLTIPLGDVRASANSCCPLRYSADSPPEPPNATPWPSCANCFCATWSLIPVAEWEPARATTSATATIPGTGSTKWRWPEPLHPGRGGDPPA